MLHSALLQRIVVSMPGMTKQLGQVVVSYISSHPCKCSACRALINLMRDPPVAEYFVSLTSATVVLESLKLQRNDYCLQMATRICDSIGHSISQATVCSAVLHQLEQAHAYSRETLREIRIRHWFERYFINTGIEPGDRFTRLIEEVRVCIQTDAFPVHDEAGFQWDDALRRKIVSIGDAMLRQVR